MGGIKDEVTSTRKKETPIHCGPCASTIQDSTAVISTSEL